MKKLFLSGLLFCSALMMFACDFIVGTIDLGGLRNPRYTITFAVLDEYMECDDCDPQMGEKGSVIFLPTARWTGKDDDREFDGWFLCFDYDCKTYHRFGGAGEQHIIEGDVDMVPQFSRIGIRP